MMFAGLNSLLGKEDNVVSTKDYIQDLEVRNYINKDLTSNDIPMPFLSNTATLTDVIKVVNELIKRDLNKKKVR